MSSFKSFIKHPVVAGAIAGTIAIIAGAGILKFTGYLSTVWHWLKILPSIAIGLLTANIPLWIVIISAGAVGLTAWLLKKLHARIRKLTDIEKKILGLFEFTNDKGLKLAYIASMIEKSQLVTKHALESLESKNLISLTVYGEYVLTEEGRDFVVKKSPK